MRLQFASAILLLSTIVHAQDVTVLTKQGDDAFANKQYEQAVQSYIQAIRLNPNSADLYEKLGLVYQAQHNSRYLLAFKKADQLRQQQGTAAPKDQQVQAPAHATPAVKAPAIVAPGRGGLEGAYLSLGAAFGGGHVPIHYFFLPDGRCMFGEGAVPRGAFTAAAYERTCQDPNVYCGTYSLNGDKLAITGRDGKTLTRTLTRTPDGIQIDGQLTDRVDRYKFPVNAKLNGSYEWSGATANIGAATTFTFHTDGTFERSSIGAVHTRATGAVSQNATQGTYRLSVNALELTSGGKSELHTIYPYGRESDPPDAPKTVVIDGAMCRRR